MISLDKLISIASPPLAAKPRDTLENTVGGSRARLAEIDFMLANKNGFYAFEGALHVFHAPDFYGNSNELSLIEWNSLDLWRGQYGDLTEGLFFFAEDVFGVQFAIQNENIVSFEPESGEIKQVAGDVEEWARAVLSDFRLLTGFPVAHDWQRRYGGLPSGKRLLPKIPFIFGGQYDSSNLIAVDAAEGMRYRGQMWQQIRDLPDGAQVRLMPLPAH